VPGTKKLLLLYLADLADEEFLGTDRATQDGPAEARPSR